jgi:predicted P-loop ATPase
MRPGISLFDDIDTFARAEKGRLKAIITQQHTTMRAAYKEHEETYLRRGVMMGTTNDALIIPDDPTGNTRFAVGEVMEKLPFETMIKHRADVIAHAYALVQDGYEPDDIDFDAMAEKYTEKSSITESLEEFISNLRDGTFKVNNIDIFKAKAGGSLYFKSSRYWQHVTGRTDYRPRDFERKELGLRARALGLMWRDGSCRVTVGTSERIKNVWELPQGQS